ncbi:nucleotidyltransferase family protein [Bacillus alkalicellulosilyticus]|uniref:nucleotidyltransferase family protein n=1 Tax=Alkalihalobacterium alkalicellulosilyticum TaxID=1912214 RepID=UPI000996A68A|nr:nucleotidyltransferase family protein [Bacillus alkalicellulosilyticus]
MEKSVSAIILAAGCSTRMGRPKQLLKLNENFMLEHVINQVLLHPFTHVYIIVGYQGEKIKQAIRIEDKRVRWVDNNRYYQGQSTSIQTAFEHIDKTLEGTMIFLGDQPYIQIETTALVLTEGFLKLSVKRNMPFMIRPSYRGIPGHPVFLGHYQSINFSVLHGDEGGRALFHTCTDKRIIPVQDANVIFDIDTQEDYQQALAML